tara:strand:- start:4703 stop:5326 length:624 start_codon:yes stop_codon:yes gene_type:complete
MGKKSKSASHWRQIQRKDPYFEKALSEGWRSRAVYKLEEIHVVFTLFKHGMQCVDLGSSPGGWSQLAVKLVGSEGKIWAMDQQIMEPISGVEFLLGDFTDQASVTLFQSHIKDVSIDLVMSDMAPNISGNRVVDQARAMNLAEDAFRFAIETLNEGGSFLTKLFQGEGFEEFIGVAKQHFESVRIFKPKASRSESREVYMLARTYGI